ncbi:hypothetical protein DW1_0600 [Proteiniborus sp. DW1]|uniref:hypothetical protein n=1 Tax=Proteiniborus sp. DW1 TaxID=1889883 RepID=UPI00092E0DFA|nr:hypothetical protein [Proteiniborus sp. DW1]SCG82209.1 hypothetical protein DW1_0600 [Proteiniborus sp. DW1]
MKEFLSNEGINFLYLDITENMLNLKNFLKYRDNAPVFEDIKKAGKVGLPCVVINNGEEIVFDKESIKLEQLKDKEGGK